MDRINELTKQIADAIAELRDSYGVYGGIVNPEETVLQMSPENLDKHFPIHFEQGRECEEFPVELFVVVNGVKFLALVKRDLREAV